jgi:hypothetical protein
MPKLANRAWMSTATSGTGTITLGSALSGYQSFADAGIANGDTVRYTIVDGANWEVGTGTYTSSGTTLTRTVQESSSADSAITLSGSATVFISAAAADILNKHVVSILVFDDSISCSTGDGAGDVFWRVPSALNGCNLVEVAAQNQTAGTTGTMDIQIARIRSGTPADMLSTKITIDSTEIDSSTAATAAVINTSNDDVATGDQIRIDVDAVHTTPARGLVVELSFRLP